MATHLALEQLRQFNKTPFEANASALVNIPVLYNLLQYKYLVFCQYSHSVLRMCSWIHMRGIAVLTTLMVHDLPSKDFHAESISWSKVLHFLISCWMLNLVLAEWMLLWDVTDLSLPKISWTATQCERWNWGKLRYKMLKVLFAIWQATTHREDHVHVASGKPQITQIYLKRLKYA